MASSSGAKYTYNQVCRYFNTPFGCWNGERCPFLHIKDTKPPCRFFGTPTGCRYGDSCHFSHGFMQRPEIGAAAPTPNPQLPLPHPMQQAPAAPHQVHPLPLTIIAAQQPQLNSVVPQLNRPRPQQFIAHQNGGGMQQINVYSHPDQHNQGKQQIIDANNNSSKMNFTDQEKRELRNWGLQPDDEDAKALLQSLGDRKMPVPDRGN